VIINRRAIQVGLQINWDWFWDLLQTRKRKYDGWRLIQKRIFLSFI